jgi:hypothetical protein
MKNRFIFLFVSLIFALALAHPVASQTKVSRSEDSAKIDALSKEYNSFDRKDWKKRRDFCVRLIDDRIISDDTKTDDVRRIFAPDLHYHRATKEHPAGGFVSFERPEKLDPTVQNRIGWHFSFQSSDNGYLWNYFLTDFNK